MMCALWISNRYQFHSLWFDPTGGQTHNLLHLKQRSSNPQSTALEARELKPTIYCTWSKGAQTHNLLHLKQGSSNPKSTALEAMELKPTIYCIWSKGAQTHNLLHLKQGSSNPQSTALEASMLNYTTNMVINTTKRKQNIEQHKKQECRPIVKIFCFFDILLYLMWSMSINTWWYRSYTIK
jgi:hypothetical protein